MDFSELDLPHEVRQGIEYSGFTLCTPVQEAVLPARSAARMSPPRHRPGQARRRPSSSPSSPRMSRNPVVDLGNSPQALIIAPTRELADQIFHEAERLGKFTGFRSLAVYGGIDYDKQRQALANGVDVLIGTPGRLIDYFKQHVYSLKKTRYSSSTRQTACFDMGFIDDLRYLLKKLPDYTKRQSMLFSATLSYRVMELAYEHMNLPEKISITPEQVTVEKVEQVLYHVGKHEKVSLLLGLLAKEAPARALIFVNTRRAADMVVERLNRNNWKAQAITGDIEQKKRLRILGDFKEGRLAILVATDVASRGIDVKDVTHVFNYDLPRTQRTMSTASAAPAGPARREGPEPCLRGVCVLPREHRAVHRPEDPVEWADEGLFAKEIRRTHEERQKSERERALRPPQPGRHRTSDRPAPAAEPRLLLLCIIRTGH